MTSQDLQSTLAVSEEDTKHINDNNPDVAYWGELAKAGLTQQDLQYKGPTNS